MEDDEITAYVDKMVAEAREILRTDKILAHLKGGEGKAKAEPADPDLPVTPPVKPPKPEVKARHWFFGETE
jgi:hypothetical protein